MIRCPHHCLSRAIRKVAMASVQRSHPLPQDVPLDPTWQERFHAAEHGERHAGMNTAVDARCRQPGQRRRCLTKYMHEFDCRRHQRPLGTLGVIAGAAKALDEAP
jgi:hypothetical protein